MFEINSELTESPRSRRLGATLFLGTLFVATMWRLVGSILQFGSGVLQVDFSAFYTAGQSLNHGLSPYVNHYPTNPSIWDGVDIYQHSRFLYPPLVATLFQPVAILPYAVAKYAWMVSSLAFLALALVLTAAIAHPRISLNQALVVGIFAASFYPLLTFLERGQIDSLTLLLLVAGIWLLIKRKRLSWLAGMVFALACLIKLHSVLLVPFLLVRRQWGAVAGYVAGWVLIAALSVGLNGPATVSDYLFNQFPRIARYGEQGTEWMKLSAQERPRVSRNSPVTKAGQEYRLYGFDFTTNGTAVREVVAALKNVRVTIKDTSVTLGNLCDVQTPSFGNPLCFALNGSVVSVGVFLVLFLLLLAWQWRSSALLSRLSPVQEFTYWQAVLITILLAGPLTWVMNTIWLLPVAILIPSYLAAPRGKLSTIFVALAALGLVVAALPDQPSFTQWLPQVSRQSLQFLTPKTVVAEALIFLSLVGVLATSPAGPLARTAESVGLTTPHVDQKLISCCKANHQ